MDDMGSSPTPSHTWRHRALAGAAGIVAAACLGGAIPAAHASVVRIDHEHQDEDAPTGDPREDLGPFDANALSVVAAPHERNRITLRYLSAARVLVTDAGSRGGLKVGRYCRRRTLRSAVCTVPPVHGVRLPLDLTAVVTGDRDDTLTAVGGRARGTFSAKLGPGDDRAHVHMPATIDGGSGDDMLTGASGFDQLVGGSGNDRLAGAGGRDALDGGAGDDRLDGGSGNDSLDGGPGRDRLDGGAGNDDLDGADGSGGVDRDRIDGGAGRDTAAYFRRRLPMRVSLGHRGVTRVRGRAEDTLRSVEDATGGLGDDLVVGDNGPNRLAGGPAGRDLLSGRGGDDTLDGDGDLLDGGSGDDLLDAGLRDGVNDCGAGNDTSRPGPRILVRPSCERVTSQYHDGTTVPVPAVVPDGLRFTVSCPYATCSTWRVIVRPALAGPGWVGSQGVAPGTVAPTLARAELPPRPAAGRATVVVPRDQSVLPTGRPVDVVIQQVLPSTFAGSPPATIDTLVWGITVP